MITVEQGLVLGLVVIALALFMYGQLRVYVIALLTLLALGVIGVLPPDQALAGFSSEPAINVASVFVLSAGLSATGVTDRIGVWIGRAAGASESRALLVITPTVALLAAVSHHFMVTAMMRPVVLRFARHHHLAESLQLVPMSPMDWLCWSRVARDTHCSWRSNGRYRVICQTAGGPPLQFATLDCTPEDGLPPPALAASFLTAHTAHRHSDTPNPVSDYDQLAPVVRSPADAPGREARMCMRAA